MRGWERQAGESAKAYEAFAMYRDAGPSRSITMVARELNKSRSLIARWSSAYDWVDRVEALEARDEMMRRAAVDEHLQRKAEDHASRRVQLVEKTLEVAELAAQQALLMARWPLSEQTLDEEGRTIIAPARWNKGTVRTMFDIAAFGASGKVQGPDPEEGHEVEWDFSDLSSEELQEYIRITDKMGVKRKDSSDGRG